ncbi:MAG: IS200/IS605 family transposase, partial [Syntrophobacterales bacterium]
HAVYDLKYHLVWVPKYRKLVLKGSMAKRRKEVFHKITDRYEFDIDTMEVKEDHAHLFLTEPPRYSPYQIMEIMKGISAKLVFREFYEVEEQLWSDGYFVRSVGDKVTSEVIRQYIESQHQEQLDFDL